MAGRPKIFEEEQIIAKAREIFWKVGYEAASTEDLLKAMQIGKGSFYLSFKGGKKELFEKALTSHASNLVKTLNQRLLSSDDPVAELREFFLDLATAPEDEKLKGCFIANTLAEMSIRDTGLKDLATQLLDGLQQAFSLGIDRAKQLGKAGNMDTELVARHLLNLWNGLSLSRRIYSNKQLGEIISINLKVLE